MLLAYYEWTAFDTLCSTCSLTSVVSHLAFVCTGGIPVLRQSALKRRVAFSSGVRETV